MERTAEQNKLASEIALLEAEARLCRYIALKYTSPDFSRLAHQAETSAHNARLFLSGRLIYQGAQLEAEIEESRR